MRENKRKDEVELVRGSLLKLDELFESRPPSSSFLLTHYLLLLPLPLLFSFFLQSWLRYKLKTSGTDSSTTRYALAISSSSLCREEGKGIAS